MKYGEFGIIRTTVQAFLVFAGLGLGVTASKFVAELLSSRPDRAAAVISLSTRFSVLIGSMAGGAIFVAAPWIAKETLNAPHLRDALRVAAVVIALSAINGALNGVLQGFERFRSIAWWSLCAGAVFVPAVMYGAAQKSVTAMTWALLASTSVHVLLNAVEILSLTSSRGMALSWKAARDEIRLLWSFSVPATLSGLLVMPVMWFTSTLLVRQVDGYAQLGVFDVANQWRLAVLFVPAAAAQVAVPVLSRLVGKRTYRLALLYNMVANTGFALLVAVPLCLAAPWIMAQHGEAFAEGGHVLAVLGASSVLMALNTVVGSAIASRGKMWLGFAFNGGWAVTLVIATEIALKSGAGALGLAWAHLIAYAQLTLVQGAYMGLLSRSDRSSELETSSVQSRTQ